MINIIAKQVALFLAIGTCFTLIVNSRVPPNKYGCSHFDCELNIYGVCKAGFIKDLFYVCYNNSCANDYSSQATGPSGPLACFLSQYPSYHCVHPPCNTDRYTEIGGVFTPLGYLEIIWKAWHGTTLFILYLTYKILDKLQFTTQYHIYAYMIILYIIYYKYYY